MNHRLISIGRSICLVAAMAAGSAQGAVVVGNLTQPVGWAGNNIGVYSGWSHAVSFTTGSDAAGYAVQSASFRLYVWPTAQGGNIGASTAVRFFSDSGGTPGAQVGLTLNNPSFGDGSSGLDANFNFTPAAPLNLAANTTYWLMISNGAVPEPQSINMYFYPGTTPSTQEGFSYNGMTSGGVGWNEDFYSVPAFALEAVVVPEPAETAALAAVGLGVFAYWRKRRTMGSTAVGI